MRTYAGLILAVYPGIPAIHRTCGNSENVVNAHKTMLIAPVVEPLSRPEDIRYLPGWDLLRRQIVGHVIEEIAAVIPDELAMHVFPEPEAVILPGGPDLDGAAGDLAINAERLFPRPAEQLD